MARMQLSDLSPRRQEMIQHLADGYSYKEIAELMKLSPATVRAMVYRLLVCTGASNRHRLVMHFYRITPVQN